ncbi:MAG: hypothetical protein AAGG81_04740 [Chlamydiota bacterium]
MSEEVDTFIDSRFYTDKKLLEMLRSGHIVSSVTLVRYLSRGVVNLESLYTPNKEMIEELIIAGAVPFHFSQRYEWEALFKNDVRIHIPISLRSTINLAALVRNSEIIDLLVKEGEEPNDYTYQFLQSPREYSLQ